MRGSEVRTTRSPRRTSRLALFAVAAVFALALTACDWPTFHRDNVHSGFVPFPDGPANPATLSPVFTVPTGSSVFSSAAIVNGVGYVGSDDGKLYAFDAAGVTNCGGSPVTCAPLWTGTTPTGFQLNSSPTVANGIVYIGSDDNFVYAWDAAGNTNCSGTPKTCTPLFADHTSSTQRSSPVVENGVLYIGSVHDTIEAFDANGHTNCSGAPKQCTPLWSGPAPGIIGAQDSIPAVANGLVYVGARDGNLYAFDANGTTGCSGAPKVCAPIWLATTAPGAEVTSSPSVVNGVLYVGSDGGDLWAYDAAGNTNCSTRKPARLRPSLEGRDRRRRDLDARGGERPRLRRRQRRRVVCVRRDRHGGLFDVPGRVSAEVGVTSRVDDLPVVAGGRRRRRLHRLLPRPPRLRCADGRTDLALHHGGLHLGLARSGEREGLHRLG